jgi:hypothetical protein
MRTSYKTLMLATVLLAIAMATLYARASAQVLTPPPKELRYQALISQPIATPDRGAVVAGTSALLLRDRVTGQCFLAVTIGNSMGLSGAECGQ